MQENILEQIVRMAYHLSPGEKMELAKFFISDVQSRIDYTPKPEKALCSAYGICAGLDPVPSEEDINRMRKDFFGRFPREDV